MYTLFTQGLKKPVLDYLDVTSKLKPDKPLLFPFKEIKKHVYVKDQDLVLYHCQHHLKIMSL